MNYLKRAKDLFYKYNGNLSLVFLALIMFSCAGADPRNVDVQLPETAPEIKITSYTQALSDLGLMTEIYATEMLKIQSNPIGDNTGTSMSTGGEIPRDITEMMKSSLNSIGGNVVYIPYDPAFIQNQLVTGYSTFENKLIPDVVLSGGITEFDRGLVTRGENTDVSAGAEFRGLPDYLPSKNVGLRYGDEGKSGLARITLDFNLLDFQTMAGISKMNAVNAMEVNKAVAGKELGISLFGQNFGLKGSVKKVQGRHAAVRLLVELSMIQVVGKYLAIPYWKLLGEDAIPDRVVTDAVSRYYYSLSDPQIVAVVREWLYLYGHDVPQNGKLDPVTKQALSAVDTGFNSSDSRISLDTFTKVYVNIPITHEARGRRQMLANLYQQQETVVDAAPAPVEEVQYTQEAPQQTEQVQQQAVQQESQAPAPKKAAKRTGIGKFLSDEEW